MTAYSQPEQGVSTAVGCRRPPSDGKWCYDNDDGSVDPMTECANGYGDRLRLGDRFTRTVDFPLKYLLVNWSPHGHTPPEVYDLPHFDVHFYLQPEAERLRIRPGPCEERVNCEDYELGRKLPAAQCRPADFVNLEARTPGMGTHLTDTTGPEFQRRAIYAYVYLRHVEIDFKLTGQQAR